MSTNKKHLSFRLSYILCMISVGLLTCLIFYFMFFIGQHGFINKYKPINKKIQDTYTVIDNTDDIKKEIKDYKSILNNPYMININKNSPVPEDYDVDMIEYEGIMLETNTAKALSEFIAAAKKEGISVTIFDGYRTKDQQEEMYESEYQKTFAAGYTDEETVAAKTDMIVAHGGYSENQTGLAVDMSYNQSKIAAEVIQSDFYKFALENCAKYGFIISYTENNKSSTGYEAMPWHFRYVGGEEQAQYIMNKGISLNDYILYLSAQIDSLQQRLDSST